MNTDIDGQQVYVFSCTDLHETNDKHLWQDQQEPDPDVVHIFSVRELDETLDSHLWDDGEDQHLFEDVDGQETKEVKSPATACPDTKAEGAEAETIGLVESAPSATLSPDFHKGKAVGLLQGRANAYKEVADALIQQAEVYQQMSRQHQEWADKEIG